MQIVIGDPPLFGEIDAKFHIAGEPVIFTFGDTIYNPQGIQISPELMAHERVHCRRQGADVDGWWRRYLEDTEFRLAEELPAHRMEFAAFCGRFKDRNLRARFLAGIAARLSGPLYGGLLGHGDAMRAIRALA